MRGERDRIVVAAKKQACKRLAALRHGRLGAVTVRDGLMDAAR
jgi:hypothetical protein